MTKTFLDKEPFPPPPWLEDEPFPRAPELEPVAKLPTIPRQRLPIREGRLSPQAIPRLIKAEQERIRRQKERIRRQKEREEERIRQKQEREAARVLRRKIRPRKPEPEPEPEPLSIPPLELHWRIKPYEDYPELTRPYRPPEPPPPLEPWELKQQAWLAKPRWERAWISLSFEMRRIYRQAPMESAIWWPRREPEEEEEEE